MRLLDSLHIAHDIKQDCSDIVDLTSGRFDNCGVIEKPENNLLTFQKMKLIAKIKEKEIWFHEDLIPYDFESPFTGEDYVCVIFNNDPNISIDEQYSISRKIVKSGCKYAMCAGYNCTSWDDSIDEEYLATDENFDPPDNTFIMTTWHDDESIADIVFHMLNCTSFDNHKFTKYLIYLIGKQEFLKRKIQNEIEIFINR